MVTVTLNLIKCAATDSTSPEFRVRCLQRTERHRTWLPQRRDWERDNHPWQWHYWYTCTTGQKRKLVDTSWDDILFPSSILQVLAAEFRYLLGKECVSLTPEVLTLGDASTPVAGGADLAFLLGGFRRGSVFSVLVVFDLFHPNQRGILPSKSALICLSEKKHSLLDADVPRGHCEQ